MLLIKALFISFLGLNIGASTQPLPKFAESPQGLLKTSTKPLREYLKDLDELTKIDLGETRVFKNTTSFCQSEAFSMKIQRKALRGGFLESLTFKCAQHLFKIQVRRSGKNIQPINNAELFLFKLPPLEDHDEYEVIDINNQLYWHYRKLPYESLMIESHKYASQNSAYLRLQNFASKTLYTYQWFTHFSNRTEAQTPLTLISEKSPVEGLYNYIYILGHQNHTQSSRSRFQNELELSFMSQYKTFMVFEPEQSFFPQLSNSGALTATPQ